MTPATSTPDAYQKRAAHPDFVSTFSLDALRDRLPLCLPVPSDSSACLRGRYRSEYRYLGWDDLRQPGMLATLSLFEIVLRLFDFASIRDYLARHCYRPSRKGQVPFDPVSLFLCLCLRRELKRSWRGLAKLLAGEHGDGWRRRFGFRDGVTPSASGLRSFFRALGPETVEELNSMIIDALHQAGLLPERSTFPGDPPDRGVSISHDLMLHEARSNMRCAYVTATCYQPAPRPCPAKQKGKEGCDCRDEVCAQVCRRATPLDRDARYIYYEGRNKTADLPPSGPPRGRDVYGYASAPDRLLDDRFACAWTLRTGGLYPANSDERKLFPANFARLQARYPWLKIGEVLADAALGYQDCLDPIWEVGALRMVDIRAHESDADPQLRLQRGYDEHGHLLCLHGRKMQSRGHDYEHRRTKWCCEHVCERDPNRPAPDCPYRQPEYKHGQVINVGRTLPDSSVRLAREIAYDSPTWKKRYGRRNLSESRNGLIQGMGLKRLPSCGLSHAHRDVALADLLENLLTLSRLVEEATRLALKGKAG
jgi:hypothetical protein